MTEYIIAVKKGERHRAPLGLPRPLQGIEGLEILGASNPFRIQVAATDAAIRLARSRLGHYCHIEKLVRHVPLVTSVPPTTI